MKWIEIKYLPCYFWTCQGIGVRVRIGWWRAAVVVGVPGWIANIFFPDKDSDMIQYAKKYFQTKTGETE
jgi:hypothetical protein